jgi:type I restriction enzyme R subunit
MRRIIKRLLKKYDYPPEQAKKALKIVMRQAEKMCSNFKIEDIKYNKVAKEIWENIGHEKVADTDVYHTEG